MKGMAPRNPSLLSRQLGTIIRNRAGMSISHRSLTFTIRRTSSSRLPLRHHQSTTSHCFNTVKQSQQLTGLYQYRSFSSSAGPSKSNKAALPMLLVIGAAMLAWGASDFVLDSRQGSSNELLRQEYEQWFKMQTAQQNYEQDSSSEVLLYCVIRRATGVTHCLTGAEVGDLVEVLQESVGPDKQYNLCRLHRKNVQGLQQESVVGWFPIRWLQPLDDYDQMLQRQLEQLQREEEESSKDS